MDKSKGLVSMESWVLEKFDIAEKDNLRARRIHTQFTSSVSSKRLSPS